MRAFRKNTAVADLLRREPTLGLPLFENTSSPSLRGGSRRGLTKRTQAILNAPRAIEVAQMTRRLSHDILTFDATCLAKKQFAVWIALLALCKDHGDATNQEIADWMHWPINRVCGRVFELRQMGIEGGDGKEALVVAGQRRACRSTGSIVQAWEPNPNLQPDQPEES